MTTPKPKQLMRGFLAIALVGAFMLALLWTFQFEIPEANRDLVNFMLGQMAGMAAMAVAYYFGTSQSTTDQNDAWRADPHFPPTPHTPAEPPSRPFGESGDLPRPTFAPDNPDNGDFT